MNTILDGYIKERLIGVEINIPLEKLLNKILDLHEKAFKKFDNDFSKGIQERDISNFIYYHSVRNIKLALLKIGDSLKEAKERELNPAVAKDLKGFIKPLKRFINAVERVKPEKLLKVMDLSEKLESFRDEAEKFNFLCNLEEEIQYDKLSEEDFKELLSSIRDIDLDEEDLDEEDLDEEDLD